MYHYAGHRIYAGAAAGKLLNPYRFVQQDGEWVVEVGYGTEGKHFVVDITDLPAVLNLERSRIGSQPLVLDDKTTVEFYQVRDDLVPTWAISGDAGIACRSWPETKEAVRLNRKLLGVQPTGRRLENANGNAYDFRRSNLVQKTGTTEAIEWPHEVNPKLQDEMRALTEARVIEAFPGRKPGEPEINPYWLMEYNGHRFYRMRALNGELFYFSEQDLDRVVTVCGVDNPRWYKAVTGRKSKEGYIVCHPKTTSPVYLHRHLIGDVEEEQTVDHANWNKWDNRRSNLRIVTQSEQNKNRAPRRESATKEYGEVPKADRPPYVNALSKSDDGHNAGFAITMPVYELPEHLRNRIKTNDGSRPVVVVRAERKKGHTVQQQMKQLWMVHDSMIDGSYFNADGTVNEAVKAAQIIEAYGAKYPDGVPFAVAKIAWEGQKSNKTRVGMWRLGKQHPLAEKHGRLHERTKDGESPRDALVRLYIRLLELDPTTAVAHELRQVVKQARHKRASEGSEPAAKRQTIQSE